MAHDETKVLLGATTSTCKESTREEGDPSIFKAGLAVRKKPNGELSLSESDGELIGLSLGRSLSENKKTSVVRDGLGIPVLLKDEGVAASQGVGDLVYSSKEIGESGNNLTVQLQDGGIAGSETMTLIDGDLLITIESGVSTAQQIKDAVDNDPEASEIFSVSINPGSESNPQTFSGQAPLAGGVDSYSYVTKGAGYKVDDGTGLASSDGEVTGAHFSSGPIKGIDPVTKEEFDCALIDAVGGL